MAPCPPMLESEVRCVKEMPEITLADFSNFRFVICRLSRRLTFARSGQGTSGGYAMVVMFCGDSRGVRVYMGDGKSRETANSVDVRTGAGSNGRTIVKDENGVDVPLHTILFPNGPPADRHELLDHLSTLMRTTEQVLSRRQLGNNYFLTINSVFMAAIGYVVTKQIDLNAMLMLEKQVHQSPEVKGYYLLIGVIALLGAIISYIWYRMAQSYVSINRAKWEVTKEIERELDARVYTAQDKLQKHYGYKATGQSESYVCIFFMLIYAVIIVVVIIHAL